MRRNVTWPTLLILATSTLIRADVPTTRPLQDVHFLRFVGDARHGGVLETADVAFRNADGVELRLVGAVHFGEGDYYQRLNDSFKPCDAVLYEEVTYEQGEEAPPRGVTPPTPETQPTSEARVPLLHTILNLRDQSDINTQAPNFIHADMDGKTFDAKIKGVQTKTPAAKMFASALEASNDDTPTIFDDPEAPKTLFDLLTRPDGERQCRLIVAAAIAAPDGLEEDPEHAVICIERNNIVINVLKETLAKQDKKRIAIFYGAAHMPDLAKQIETMGFARVSTQWYRVLDARIRPNEPSAFQLLMKRSQRGQRPPPGLATADAAPKQLPTLATPENAKSFFNGKDLAGWWGHPGVWKVENGELVGKSEKGLPNNEFLKSNLLVKDFRLTFQIKLVPNTENSGVQFRSVPVENSWEMKGYQADVGATWWGKVYHESGRGLLTKADGDQFVKPNDWNTYEILAVGHKIKTAINGKLCSDLDDPEGELEGVIAVQVHAGGPTEVRFKDFELEVDPKPEMKTVH